MGAGTAGECRSAIQNAPGTDLYTKELRIAAGLLKGQQTQRVPNHASASCPSILAPGAEEAELRFAERLDQIRMVIKGQSQRIAAFEGFA